MRHVRYVVLAAGLSAVGVGGYFLSEHFRSSNVSRQHIEMNVKELRPMLQEVRSILDKPSHKRRKALYQAAENYGRQNIFNLISVLRRGDRTYGEFLAETQPLKIVDPSGEGFDAIADSFLSSPEHESINALDGLIRKSDENLEADYMRGKHEIYRRVLASEIPEELKQAYRTASEREQVGWERERARRLEKQLEEKERKK